MAIDIKLQIALLISAVRSSHWEGPDQVREARFTVRAENPISAVLRVLHTFSSTFVDK